MTDKRLSRALRVAIYARVSTDRQTIENQFEDLLRDGSSKDANRDWCRIRQLLSDCVYEERRPSRSGEDRVVYKVRPEIVEELAKECVYVEQAKSSRSGAKRRPLFERMKRDASLRRFESLLVWKVSRLGRQMREVITTVYELADLGITVIPIHSQTGAITSAMGRLLWAIQAWYAEMENDERSQTIRAGLAKAKNKGKSLGRPRVIVDVAKIATLRASGASWSTVCESLRVSKGTAQRAFASLPKNLTETATLSC